MESQPIPNPKPDTNKSKDNDFHTQTVDKNILKNSAKDIGLVDPPIVSKSPSSKVEDHTNDKKPPKVFKDVSKLFGDDEDEDYPYHDLELEQGFFIPTQPNDTNDNLLAKILKSIDNAKKRYGEIEVDENGDEIWEVTTVRTKKRNEDGTIQLHGDEPILGADFHQHPKYIYTRNFIAKVVTKGQEIGKSEKVDADGVIVIRVA